MSSFHIAIEKPEEIIPRLGKQELHWKKGRSAYELSTLWMNAGGIPPTVKSVLDQAQEWRDAELVHGIFENQTKLPGRGNPSQTDLLAIAALPEGRNGILGVEGKVDEPFGTLVSEWLLAASDKVADNVDQAAAARSRDNKKSRLEALCATLRINPDIAGNLHYQLIHRSWSALSEAKRFDCRHAVMLVHSFDVPFDSSSMPACFDDFARFSAAIGLPVSKPQSVSEVKVVDGIKFRLAWVSDRPSTSPL
jgi:hypothetical protein